LSPYIVRQIGYEVRSGQLDLTLALQAKQGVLQGVSQLMIRSLDLDPADAAKTAHLEKKLRVPLDTALSLLQDKENNIKLEVPISGDTSDPEFGLGDAIDDALIKAMKFSATTFLKYALQPYGTFLAVAELGVKAGKKVTAIRLDPVFFKPGSAHLPDGASPYLERVAELMKNRPRMRLELCGKAVETDRIHDKQLEAEKASSPERLAAQADGNTLGSAEKKDVASAGDPVFLGQEQLEGLARERASAIKRDLVKHRGIDARRLFICYPKIEGKKDDEPRVELLVR
jgi:hypothetical protein